MNLDKIKKLLKVDTLDESTQEEVQNYLTEMVDMKAKEKAKEISEKVSEDIKEELTEEYETKFEEYKSDLIEKFSDFIDNVIDEELEIPEKIKEFARKGELYSDLIEQFKSRLAIDEDVLDNEVKDLLSEARKEIKEKKSEIDKIVKEKLELKQDATTFASKLHLYEKCKGLTKAQSEKVHVMLEGETDKSEIDRKFDIIVEDLTTDDNDDNNDNNDDNNDNDNNNLDENHDNLDDPFSKYLNAWTYNAN